MADRRAVLFGGPLDGLEIAPRVELFIWVERAAQGGVRVYSKPAEKRGRRLLYRREGDRWVYSGDAYAVCGECENPQPKTASGECGLCGARLIPA